MEKLINPAGIVRREFILGTFGVVFAAGPAFVAAPAMVAKAGTAQEIVDHFFCRQNHDGRICPVRSAGRTNGRQVFIERPGRVRFNYEKPSAFRVVSDGKSVVISNWKLKTADLYPLSKTPLKMLLDEKIDIFGDRVQTVREEDDLTTITLADKSVFGNSTIAMMFDPDSFELRQWTIRDAQGKDTTVMIFNVRQGVDFDPTIFEIDYRKVAETNNVHGNR